MASLITGAKMRNSILGVHSQGELIGYSSLIVGYGFFGDIIYSMALLITGAKMRNSILGVHSQGELIGYSSLIVGYGFF